MSLHLQPMREALRLSVDAFEKNEVPVGAVITVDGRIIARGYNQVESLIDPTAHAEIIALGAAADHLGVWRMEGATIYITLEPCVMCIGAILNARIGNIVYGASDPRMGACGSRYDLVTGNPYLRNVNVLSGILAEESEARLKEFFVRLRKQKKEQPGRGARVVNRDGLENR